jgi:hypothetical protein
LETGLIQQKYFLSQRALNGIVRRLTEKGKLPELVTMITKVESLTDFYADLLADGGTEDQ